MDAVDDVAFLAGSEPRAAVLAALHEEGALSRDALVERCGAARVTVVRNLEQLEDRGLVAAQADGWRLTPLGELLAGEFLSLLDTAAAADDLAPVLERLPADAFDLDPAALAGARVTVSTAANPYAPAERHAETLLSADRAEVLVPAVSAQTMQDTLEPVQRGDLEMDIVAGPSVGDTFRTDLADLVAAHVDTGRTTIHVADETVPFFLGVLDGTVQLGVADEEGIPRALAESDDSAVREWAEDRLASYREAAEPLAL